MIESLEPERAEPGVVVSVTGRYFGSRGRLEVDGIALDRDALRSWNDNLIVFTMPRDLRSGMVRVQTENGLSNPVFLTNRNDLPRITDDHGVHARSVSRRDAVPGTVVTVRGENFGLRTPGSSFGFYYPESGEQFDFSGNAWWIVRWVNREFQFVLPEGLPPGPVHLVLNGRRAATDLVVQPPTGSVSYGEPRHLHFHQGVDVQASPGEPLPELFALLVGLPELPAQPEVSIVEDEGSATGEDTPSARVYRPAPVADDTGEAGDGADGAPGHYRASRLDAVARRSIRWQIDSALPVATLRDDEFRRAFQRFLSDRDGVPVYDELVRNILGSAINLNNTPLVIARTVHRETQRRLIPDRSGTTVLMDALEGIAARASVYADLTVALLRASGLPARRQFGYLLADTGATLDHAWAEVFLPGVGWVPLDPALGDGMYEDVFRAGRLFYGDDLAADTFGALDDRRVTTHVDGIAYPRIFPQGAVLSPEATLHAAATVRVEARGRESLESVDVVWQLPRITTIRRPSN